MNKKILTLGLISFIITFAATAQDAEPGHMLTFETGVLVGYDMAASAAVGGTAFGLDFSVADNMSIGVQTVTLGSSYNLFKLTYLLNPSIGFIASLGQDTTTSSAAAGLGATYKLGKSTETTGFVSGYKIKADFIFPVTDIASGAMAISAVLNFGI